MGKATTARQRNTKGTGSVRLRSNGRHEYRFTVLDENGIRKQRSVYGATQTEAINRGKKQEDLHRKGLAAKKDKRTLRAFAEEWIERKTLTKAANTVRNYRSELKFALDVLGDKKIQAVRPEDIQRLITRMGKEGKAPRTQRKVLERLRGLFREAVRLELTYRNPADAIELDLPPTKRVSKAWSKDEVARLLKVADKHWLGLFFRLALATGLRRGETLALSWGDVDLLNAEIWVRRNWTLINGRGGWSDPKTQAATRVLPLPQGLRVRLAEARRLLEERLGTCEIDNQFLFQQPGKDHPYHPNTPNRFLTELCKEAGIPKHRIHDLRHTYGSLALADGAPLELVAERLGHKDPGFTLRTYRHVLPHERGYVFDLDEMLSGKPRAMA